MIKGLFLALAIGVFVPVTSAHPISETGWGRDWAEALGHGDEHLAAGEYARAWDSYEKATLITPHASEGFIRLATTAYRWGDAVPARRAELWSTALRHADRARFLDPYSGEAAFLAAVIRYRMGDYHGAIDVYAALERVRKGDIELYLDLAVAAHKLGDAQLAGMALQAAYAIDPRSERVERIARGISR